MTRLRIGIAGAGLLGRLLAVQLARAGHAVHVHDPAPGPDARGAAGWTAAGMLSPLAELETRRRARVPLGPALARSLAGDPGARLPQPVEFRREGSLLLAHREDAGAARRVVDLLARKAPAEHQAAGARCAMRCAARAVGAPWPARLAAARRRAGPHRAGDAGAGRRRDRHDLALGQRRRSGRAAAAAPGRRHGVVRLGVRRARRRRAAAVAGAWRARRDLLAAGARPGPAPAAAPAACAAPRLPGAARPRPGRRRAPARSRARTARRCRCAPPSNCSPPRTASCRRWPRRASSIPKPTCAPRCPTTSRCWNAAPA